MIPLKGNRFFSGIIYFALLVLMLFGWLQFSIAPASAEPLTIRVGIYDNPPKLWVDEQGRAQGFWPDIINAIAKMENWSVEYVKGSWDECLARLKAGEIDMMPDVALSADRAAIYDFNSETAFTSWGLVYARKGVKVDSFFDFNGKRIAILESGIHYEGPGGLKNILDSFSIQAQIVGAKEYEDVFSALEKNEADIGIVSRIFGVYEEKNYNVARTDLFFNPVELRFAFPKGAEKNSRLIAAIDDDLRRMKADPGSVYHQALSHYFLGAIEKVEVLPRWFFVFIWLLFGVGVLAIFYFIIQWRNRKRLENLLQKRTVEIAKEKERFQLLFNNSIDALILLDTPSLKIIECNKSALKMSGYSKDDLLGKTPIDLAPQIQPDGRPTVEVAMKLLAEVFKKGGASIEWLLRNAEGKNIYTATTLTPLQMDSWRVILAALRDITAQKMAEEKIRALENLKSRFITVLSHVTRTPLNQVRWTMESLLSGDFGKISKEGTVLLKQAIASNQAILRLINNMNMVLDIERGPLILNKMPLSLLSLVLSVKKNFIKMEGCEDIKCKVIVPKTKLPALNLDAEKIRWVIESIFDNAKRYMGKRPGEVKIWLSEKNGRVRCSVSDTGIGIPKDEQPYIFDRFFRASNAATAYPDGLGVGLYIAKAIVEAHGGKIGFESKEGIGSTFWIEFPAAKEHAV